MPGGRPGHSAYQLRKLRLGLLLRIVLFGKGLCVPCAPISQHNPLMHCRLGDLVCAVNCHRVEASLRQKPLPLSVVKTLLAQFSHRIQACQLGRTLAHISPCYEACMQVIRVIMHGVRSTDNTTCAS